MPVPVEYDTRVNEQVVTCLSKSCVRYKSFKVCCHTVAIANKLNVLSTRISKLNAKSTTEQALMNSANVSRHKNCGKKENRLLKRKKNHLVISHRKLQSYYRFQIEVNWSCHNHPVLHEDMPIQYQQNLIFNNIFISQILFYNFIHLRILLSILRHQQEI